MKGVVAGGSPQTVEAGAAMFRQGGNAVDAAVAATFAGFVAEAAISTVGGGGFALVHRPGQDPVLYDFFCSMPGLGRGKLPGSLDFSTVQVVFEDTVDYFRVGRGSTAVPGNPAGLAQLLEDAGTLPLGTVLEPAIRLARDGLALAAGQAYLIKLVGPEILCYTDGSAAIFAPHGQLLTAGEHFANPALAATFERFAVDGWRTLYTGDLADAIVADHAAHGGLITADDLAAYRVFKRDPLRVRYRDYTICTNPPPSAGGILITYALGLLARADLAAYTHGGADHVALLAEIMRQANLARRDCDLEALAAPCDWDAWLDETRLGGAWACVKAALAAGPSRQGPDLPGGPSSTTHVSAMDESGLAVGITTSPGETGGYVVGDTGLLMNNILGETDINQDGFHTHVPGARLPSMMAPTLVLDGDAARLVVGSGGSNRLRSAIFQLLSNVLDWEMPVDEAVARARVHFENDLLDLEAGYDPGAAETLETRGYRVTRWSQQSLYFGGTHVTRCDPEGPFSAAGDARRGGAVAYWHTGG